MLNFGLIKITFFYIICICSCHLLGMKIDDWIWLSLVFIAVVVYLGNKSTSYPIYILMLSITLYQFSNIQPDIDMYNEGYCKIKQVKSSSYNTKLFCSCKSNNHNFESIVYYQGKENIKKGEIYFIEAKFTRIQNKNLPHEFSYVKFLQKKGIFYESNNLSGIRLRKIKETDKLGQYHERTIHWINLRLERFFSPDKLGLINALCFGDKSQINVETYEYFRKAGLMHIIAVSGMHVGLIQFILLFLLQLIFGKRSKMIIFQQSVVVLSLIGFAWLCQFSLSVVRSVFMFSILYYTMLSRRILLPIHGLFLSAFLILLYDPLQIFDLGFQFSYLATFGLLYMSKYIQKWGYMISIKPLRWVVQASLISIIAQIFLSPLLFYYFGEIPIWFLLFNIPGFVFVSAIIILIAVFFIFSLIHDELANGMSIGITYLIDGFEYILKLVDYSDTLYLTFSLDSFLEVILYSLIIVLMGKSFLKQQWKWMKITIGICVLFIGVKVYSTYRLFKRSELIVWNTNMEQAITNKIGNEIHYYSSYNLPIEKRIEGYVQGMNTTLIRRACIASDNKEVSHLFNIRESLGDTIVCVLYQKNQFLEQYFKREFPEKKIQYLLFKTLRNQYEDSIVNKDSKKLEYGPTLIPKEYGVYFYP